MPPCAHRVEPSSSTVLVTSSTRSTRWRSRSAVVSPAMPGADHDDVGVRRPAGLRARPARRASGQAHASPTGSMPARPGVGPVGGERLQRPAARPEPDRQVVDQPGGADPGGHREQRLAAVPLGHVQQGLRVHQHQVVDQRERLGHQHRAGRPADRAGPLDAAAAPGPQRPGQRQRHLAVARRSGRCCGCSSPGRRARARSARRPPRPGSRGRAPSGGSAAAAGRPSGRSRPGRAGSGAAACRRR